MNLFHHTYIIETKQTNISYQVKSNVSTLRLRNVIVIKVFKLCSGLINGGQWKFVFSGTNIALQKAALDAISFKTAISHYKAKTIFSRISDKHGSTRSYFIFGYCNSVCHRISITKLDCTNVKLVYWYKVSNNSWSKLFALIKAILTYQTGCPVNLWTCLVK